MAAAPSRTVFLALLFCTALLVGVECQSERIPGTLVLEGATVLKLAPDFHAILNVVRDEGVSDVSISAEVQSDDLSQWVVPSRIADMAEYDPATGTLHFSQVCFHPYKYDVCVCQSSSMFTEFSQWLSISDLSLWQVIPQPRGRQDMLVDSSPCCVD